MQPPESFLVTVPMRRELMDRIHALGRPGEITADVIERLVSAAEQNNKRFTPEQVKEFRDRYAAEGDSERLAQDGNVTVASMQRLLRGVTYTDCDGPVYPHRPSLTEGESS